MTLAALNRTVRNTDEKVGTVLVVAAVSAPAAAVLFPLVSATPAKQCVFPLRMRVGSIQGCCSLSLSTLSGYGVFFLGGGQAIDGVENFFSFFKNVHMSCCFDNVVLLPS